VLETGVASPAEDVDELPLHLLAVSLDGDTTSCASLAHSGADNGQVGRYALSPATRLDSPGFGAVPVEEAAGPVAWDQYVADDRLGALLDVSPPPYRRPLATLLPAVPGVRPRHRALAGTVGAARRTAARTRTQPPGSGRPDSPTPGGRRAAEGPSCRSRLRPGGPARRSPRHGRAPAHRRVPDAHGNVLAGPARRVRPCRNSRARAGPRTPCSTVPTSSRAVEQCGFACRQPGI
jgi:hypothetical protein